MGEFDKILTVPVQNAGGNDMAPLMAMMNQNQFNNPWAYLILLALFQNGGFGFGNRGNGGVAMNDINDRFNALQQQLNDNQNTSLLDGAIKGNGFALSQLAQNLNVDANALREAINSVNANITRVGSDTGMGFANVVNAINMGNLNIIQQMKDCCCATQKQILEQGYQGRIETINQTNDLSTVMRAETGLARAEIAAFRQAWEQGRYADLLEQKNELQQRLNLLELQNSESAAVQAAVAPLKAEIQALMAQVSYMAAHQMPTYAQAYVPGFPVGGAAGLQFGAAKTTQTQQSGS